LNAFFRNAVTIVDDADFNSYHLAFQELSLLQQVQIESFEVVKVAVHHQISAELLGDEIFLRNSDIHFDFAPSWSELQAV
jgi:hypothetical protein